MAEVLPPPPAWVQQRLLTLTGLRTLDMGDVLHADLARAVYELGAGASDGVVLQRLRWHFAWHLRDAGERFAAARVNYEHHIDREAVRFRVEGEKSGDMALRRANGTDEAKALLLKYRLAEQAERSLRKFLDAVESAVKLYQTARADERAADRAHAQGIGGGA